MDGQRWAVFAGADAAKTLPKNPAHYAILQATESLPAAP